MSLLLCTHGKYQSNVLKNFFLLLILLSLLGCQNLSEPKSPFMSMYVSISDAELDSILSNQNYKASADIIIIDNNIDTIYDGPLKQIKTRGNASWDLPKKTFNIKFQSNLKLPELYKGKNFVLLANAFDGSHLRNAIALDLASRLGLPAPKYNYLSLYINGKYAGLYMITNKVEISKHIVDINDLEDENRLVNNKFKKYQLFSYGDTLCNHRKGVLLEQNPDNISGGYLLDMGSRNRKQYYIKSQSGFSAINGDLIRIKNPKHASEAEVEYIADVYNQMISSFSKGTDISEHIDVSSFAKYCLLQDLILNYDGGLGSFYMYKEIDNPLIYAGPAWDFDIAFNNIWFWGRSSMPNQEHCILISTCDTLKTDNLLMKMCQNEQFRDSVINIYENFANDVIRNYIHSGRIDSLCEQLRYDAERDNNLYHLRKDPSYDDAVRRVSDFLCQRFNFFEWYLHADTNHVIRCIYYEQCEDGEEKATHTYIVPQGEAFTLPEPAYAFGIFNNTSVPSWYYAGTDSLFVNGTILNEDCAIEIRWRKPTWKEVQIRRLNKKLKSLTH